MDSREFHLSRRDYGALVVVAALALGVVLYGVRFAPERIWPNLLLDGFYVLSLSVSAMFFLATQRLSAARWSAGLRRIPEAFMLALPVAVVLLALLFFGRQILFVWCRPGGLEPGPPGRTVYLVPSFFLARVVVTLAIWAAFAWLFRRVSLEQDDDPAGNLFHHDRLNRLSGAFVFVFAISFTFAAYDWLVSLEPHWFTTMFAVYVFAGTFVQGIAAVTLGAVVLRQRGFLRDIVTEDKLHDLGKMIFAFSTFWAYIWVCQYLLIWYGNIPEEITHYLSRTNGPWLILFAINLIVNWVVPFVALLSVRAKRNPRVLKSVSLLVLVGRWLDWYLLIMPAVWTEPHIGAVEIAVAAGYAALVGLVFTRNLARAPLVPTYDPILAADRLSAGHPS